MISLKVRCTNCNQRFQDAPGTCPVCAATNRWEPCVHESNPQGIDPTFLHPSGVAFFAYEEAATAGAPAPAWAAATVPADSAMARSEQLNSLARVNTAIDGNVTYLGIADTATNVQVRTQVKALTRQVNGMLRLIARRFDQVD